jgi:hypothetical protein
MCGKGLDGRCWMTPHEGQGPQDKTMVAEQRLSQQCTARTAFLSDRAVWGFHLQGHSRVGHCHNLDCVINSLQGPLPGKAIAPRTSIHGTMGRFASGW